MKLTRPQRSVLERMAEGGVLVVRLEPGEAGVQETCWLDSVELPAMTVNALITARLVEQQDDVRRTGRVRTTSYFVNTAGLAALRAR